MTSRITDRQARPPFATLETNALILSVATLEVDSLPLKNAKNYPKKSNNYGILKGNNSKKLHNLHMTTTNLNPWICFYNCFAIIPDPI